MAQVLRREGPDRMKLSEGFAIGAEALASLGKGVCVVGADGSVLAWGGRLLHVGIDAVEAEGADLISLLRPYFAEESMAAKLQRAIEASAGLGETVLLRDVGIDFPAAPASRFHLCLTRSVGGTSAAAVVIIFDDVTETLRIQERYETILNSTPDGIFIIDSDRKVRLFNRACGELTGRTPEEILASGCTCDGVVHCHNEEGESYASSLCPAKAVFKGDLPHQSEEMLLTNRQGEERWVETNYSAVRGADGHVQYVIGILRDVHDRKLLEEKLQQTEKLASFGQLVAGIAHEIKNPLAIIQSSLDVLRNPERSGQQKDEALGFIGEEVRRMDDRLRSFLAFARPRALRARPLLLPGWLKRRLGSLEAVFPAIEFHLESSGPEPIVNVDEEQLTQVLTNLLLNASEAMGGKGNLWIRLRQNQGWALLEVEDSGPGIPDEQRVRIFDPFFTTKPEGTGLGLSICYQIMLAHGGTIAIGGGRHGGACFTLRFPSAGRMAEA
jgi:PAS domain S-box-containing protein